MFHRKSQPGSSLFTCRNTTRYRKMMSGGVRALPSGVMLKKLSRCLPVTTNPMCPLTSVTTICGMRGHESHRLSWQGNTCLLYTSDAADDLTRVDLGGRRI